MATKISITRTLATVKSMSNGLMLISLTRGTDEFAQEAGFNDSVGAVSDAIKENYHGLQDIIRVREDILAKVILSNATFNGTKKADEASIAVFVNPVIERYQPLEISKVIKQ
ncbi:hypothetical protein ACTFIT_001916 [Dictyostelium discoideum]